MAQIEWQRLAWLAVAGAAGTLARYGLDGLVQRWCGARFPWGILVVNALGCFLFGLVWTLAEERMALRTETRVILLTGFMGAFTTFSTFAFETGARLLDGQWPGAVGNLVSQNVLGLVCLFLGFALGRVL
jgi:fluoride exporter